MNIDKIMKSADVIRFHSSVGMSKQDIANHSWGVAMLVQYFNPNCSKNLLLKALTHDCAELEIGDIPANVKWANKSIKEATDLLEEQLEDEWGINYDITEEEAKLLKICDSLEGMIFCLKRIKMGEYGASLPFKAWGNFIGSNLELTELQSNLFENLLIEGSKYGSK